MISSTFVKRGENVLVAAIVCGCVLLAPAAASAAPTGSIAGTVTAADTHSGLEGVEACASHFVEVEEEGERVEQCAVTGPAGAYSIEGLEAGEYEVEFEPGGLPYFSEYSEGVTVGTGPTTGIDAELAPAATIAGTVTAGGEPASDDRVCAARLPEARKGLCAETGENGHYAIKFANPGSFRVEFQATGRFATQYFDHARHAPEATAVTATLGAVHAGVDATLEVGGAIQGTVRAGSGQPLQEILVCAVEASSLEPEACDETGVFGQYSLFPLATGTYKVGFSVELGREFFGEERFLGENDGFQTRFYDEQTSLAAASPIGLIAPGTVSGIDAHLILTKPSTAVPPPVLAPPTPPAPKPSPQKPRPKRLHCRHGFKKKKVRGKQRCVKAHGKRQRG